MLSSSFHGSLDYIAGDDAAVGTGDGVLIQLAGNDLFDLVL